MKPLNKLKLQSFQCTAAWIPGNDSPTFNATILKQTGFNSYIVTDGLISGEVKLTESDVTFAVPGDAIIVVLQGGSVDFEFVYSLENHLVKTSNDTVYIWTTDPTSDPTKAQINPDSYIY